MAVFLQEAEMEKTEAETGVPEPQGRLIATRSWKTQKEGLILP